MIHDSHIVADSLSDERTRTVFHFGLVIEQVNDHFELVGKFALLSGYVLLGMSEVLSHHSQSGLELLLGSLL